MNEKQHIISKGPYAHSQINKFVNVKQYIFVRKEGQKCLLLKFMNDTDFHINAIGFKLVQLNSEGKTICTQRVVYDGISVMPGTAYTPTSRIVVNEKCVDFKVVFDYVDSGYYRYIPKRGKVVVYYKEPEYRSEALSSFNAVMPQVNVSSDKIKNRNTVVWLSVLVGIAVTVMSVLSCVKDTVRKGSSQKAYEYSTEIASLLYITDDFV